MKQWYEPKVYLIRKSKTQTLDTYMREFLTYSINAFPRRMCRPIDFAWKDNRVEIRFSYEVTNTKGKTFTGNNKTTLIISPKDRIQAINDQASTKTIPAFSPGMNIRQR